MPNVCLCLNLGLVVNACLLHDINGVSSGVNFYLFYMMLMLYKVCFKCLFVLYHVNIFYLHYLHHVNVNSNSFCKLFMPIFSIQCKYSIQYVVSVAIMKVFPSMSTSQLVVVINFMDVGYWLYMLRILRKL
jgi:hypothetical protein